MEIFPIILFVVSIVMVFIAIINVYVGIALYLSYTILVPIHKVYLAGKLLPFNHIFTAILLILFYFKIKKYRLKPDFTILKPFFILYIPLLIFIILSESTPLWFQINSWAAAVVGTCVMPFMIWNLYRINEKILFFIKISIILSIVVAGLYAVILLQYGGLNPYTSYVSQYFGEMDAADVYLISDIRISLFNIGKNQATTRHPMTWAFYLCMMAHIVSVLFIKEKKNIYIIILIFLLFNILTSGVRTGLASIIIGFSYYMLMSGQAKRFVIGLIISIGLYLVVISSNDLQNIFISFVDLTGNKSSIRGSSLTMRLNQLYGAFDEINGVEMFGRGFDWNIYYRNLFGNHPTLLGFESLVFVVICNSGIAGVITWIVFFCSIFTLQRNKLNLREYIVFMDSFVIIYIAYAIGTGEYGYIRIFSVLYTYLLSTLISYEKNMFLKNMS